MRNGMPIAHHRIPTKAKSNITRHVIPSFDRYLFHQYVVNGFRKKKTLESGRNFTLVHSKEWLSSKKLLIQSKPIRSIYATHV